MRFEVLWNKEYILVLRLYIIEGGIGEGKVWKEELKVRERLRSSFSIVDFLAFLGIFESWVVLVVGVGLWRG